ncbi:hypothetical protein BDQ94DRAFT_176541 [Aspergillus welwitschiae]|uniref:Uncharacterized protein n=1 Tax=Aspergillus welwitschiae TaxID=1341132 RepID=A0A3F3PH14_9EURO|nr:hypothetical protein BDQ94DRAFT_176541 [Aspergillus welwitschiae]RDH26224.1 hypothetical protein BDQ94DRAFT_176541 [Aspergillus welwitschiae]
MKNLHVQANTLLKNGRRYRHTSQASSIPASAHATLSAYLPSTLADSYYLLF